MARKLSTSIPRIALTVPEAAASVGVGPDYFEIDELLSEDERWVLRACAVFRGGATFETLAAALERGEGWLTPDEVAKICSCYGLPLIEQRVVETVEDAGAAADEFGGEIALKAIAAGVIHKTEAGRG